MSASNRYAREKASQRPKLDCKSKNVIMKELRSAAAVGGALTCGAGHVGEGHANLPVSLLIEYLFKMLAV